MERKEYVRSHGSFNRIWSKRDSVEPDFLGKILETDNLKQASKRVKANRGKMEVDG